MTDGTTLFLDCETFCETPIKDGTHRYAESVEIMIAAWALDDPLWGEGEIVVEDLVDDWGNVFTPCSDDLLHAMKTADTIVMHNGGQFDRTVIRHAWGIELPLHKIEDTMAQAMAHGLPGGLDKLSAIFKLGEDSKHEGGRELIRLFCMPAPKKQKLRRRTRVTHPAEWQRFLRYAGGDIQSMRALRAKLPTWNYPGKRGNHATGHDAWVLDQTINDRGFKVDTDLAREAIDMVERCKVQYDAYVEDTTNGDVETAAQTQKLLAHLLSTYGVSLPDMQKGTLERRMDDPNLPGVVKELLSVRLDVAKASPTKYAALIRSASSDGRLRGTTQFCGAVRTGRSAGRIFQAKNLIRPNDAEAQQQDAWVEAIKSGAGEMFLDNPTRAAGVCLRGSVIAEPRKKLVVADLAQVEARVLAWGAGEEWKLQAFRDFDAGLGPDVYKVTAGRILHKRAEDVTKDERQMMGKVPDLACLGPDTLVLTDRGPLAIVDVSETDRLWDGEEWVKHGGLVEKGTKPTLIVDGVVSTPDHLFLAKGEWVEAKAVCSSPSTLSQVLATGSESLSSSALSGVRSAACAPYWFVAPAEERRTRSRSQTSGQGHRPGVENALMPNRGKLPSSGSNTQVSYPTTPTADGSATASPQLLTGATTPTMLPTTATVEGGSKSGLLGAKIAAGFLNISRASKVGTIPILKWIAAIRTKATNPAIFASSQNKRTEQTREPSEIYSSKSTISRPVYDIVNAGPRNRFTILSRSGAMVVHNCGFQGAAGAFGTMMRLYGLDLETKEVKRIVDDWREANSKIKQFWYDLEAAAREATLNPGVTTHAGEHVSFNRWREWLRMKLPSGHVLCYTQPRIEPHKKFANATALSYLGVNSYTRKWERIQTYGGKLAENWTQATATGVWGVIGDAMLRAEAAGYAIVMETYDELVCEVPDDDRFTTEGLCAIMTERPWWADERLPLAAEGFSSKRYRK